ncbi:MAG: hypothetical protein K5644_04695 [Lachnospiraceae bacterium]|nr:hypothetical protein [Lachnospiraceae bacterium]
MNNAQAPKGAKGVNMCQAVEGMKIGAVEKVIYNMLVKFIKNFMNNLKKTAGRPRQDYMV